VSPPHTLGLAAGDELTKGILLDRFKHPKARALVVALVALEQTAIDQRRDPVDDVVPHGAIAVADLLRRLDRAAAHKHAQSPEEQLLGGREQVVAPVDRVRERQVALWPIARAASQERETVVQVRKQFVWREERGARRRKLDRQRQPVETPADLAHREQVRVGQREDG
jgi:hypothetical protein